MALRRVAMTLFAHPDDAEILCAGTLIRLADAGWEVHIATVAAGDCGSTTLCREETAAVRRNEAVAAAAIINATYHCLEEPDVNVIFEKATNRKAIDLFRQIAPTLVFTHPRHDYMLDHEQVHLAGPQCNIQLSNSECLAVTAACRDRRCRGSTTAIRSRA